MSTRRGTTNRKTGKTTPRSKGKTHWGGKKAPKRSVKSKKSAKPAAKKK
jgi:hypothetical protein